MTKNVLIAIKGLQFEGAEDAEEIEVIQRGQYYLRNDAHYLIYEEPIEGSTEVIKNHIKFRDDELQVTKKGAVNTMLSFRKNEKNMTNYATPFGNLLMGINTQMIEQTIHEDKINVHVEYALDINYEFLADCKIDITVTALKDN